MYAYPSPDIDPVITANVHAGLSGGVDRGKYRVVDLSVLAGEQDRAAVELGEADAQVARALSQLQLLEIEAADGLLDGAIAAYERHLVALLGRDGGMTKLAEAHAAKAVARFLDADDDNAIRALQRAFVCDVAVAGSLVFPPDMGPLVARERTRFDDLGTGSLDVVTPGVAAQVLVNGSEVATSPAHFDGLPVGMSYVTLSAPNQPTITVTIAIEPGETATLEQELPAYRGDPIGMVARAHAELGQARPGPKLRAAAAAVGDPHRMLLATTRRVKGGVEVTTYLYDFTTDTLGGTNTKVVPAEDPTAESEALARSMMSIEPVAAVPRPVDTGPPIWKRRWFWPAVGITAAVIVGTIVVIAASDGMSTGEQIIFLGVGF